MIEQDTIRLLRECDAGVKMGIASFEDALPHVSSQKMSKYLMQCMDEHRQLAHEIELHLRRFRDEGKEPNPMAKTMSAVKMNMKLMLHESDDKIADLMTDGCNMGVKSLSKYLNEYEAADERSKDIAKRLIKLEEQLIDEMKLYL